MNRWLLIDVSFLCYRALHTTGGLTFNGAATGTVYGVLRSLGSLSARFPQSHFVFCFDHGQGVREKQHDFYKAYRRTRKLEPEKQKQLDDMRDQIELLKTDYLYALGYRNVFYADGYEADDVIASIAKSGSPKDRYVVVSGDKDLYQLISHRTSHYDPRTKTLLGVDEFRKIYDIHPEFWARVKAIAGCDSDGIPGIRGVGEATALKYVKNRLPRNSKLLNAIETGTDVINRNMSLVFLPHVGTPKFAPKPEDEPTAEAWNALAERLGMKSLHNDSPTGNRVRGFGVRKKGE